MHELLQETWAGMEDCVDKGLVRSIGLTNFSPEKIEKWFSDARMFPAVNQVRCQAGCCSHCMCCCREAPCHAADVFLAQQPAMHAALWCTCAYLLSTEPL